MRDRLIQYVELLFAGAPESEDIKQEILQNTLDRYDDLVAQGKSPEAAYRLAISGIGDINEILRGETGSASWQPSAPAAPAAKDNLLKKLLRIAGIFLYIICPIPLFVLSDFGMATIGLCGTLGIVAVATVLMILGKNSEKAEKNRQSREGYSDPRQELRKSISSAIWAIGFALYFVISFMTNAWYITWVVFPIIGAVQGLVNACIDLKEAE